MNASEKYKENIKKLIDATGNNKIDWKKQNPTTFYFSGKTSDGKKSLVSLQMVNEGWGDTYLFQISADLNESPITLDSSNFEYRILLQDLFAEITKHFDKKDLDFFDDILSNLT